MRLLTYASPLPRAATALLVWFPSLGVRWTEGLTDCVEAETTFAKLKTCVAPTRGVEAWGRRGESPLKGVLVCLSAGKSTGQRAWRATPSTQRRAGNCSMQRSMVQRFWSCSAALSSFAVGCIASMTYA